MRCLGGPPKKWMSVAGVCEVLILNYCHPECRPAKPSDEGSIPFKYSWASARAMYQKCPLYIYIYSVGFVVKTSGMDSSS